MRQGSRTLIRAGLFGRTMAFAFASYAMAISFVAQAVLADASPAPSASPAATPSTSPATRPAFKHPAADAAARFRLALTKGDADAAGRALADTAKPLADQPRRISRLIGQFKGDPSTFVVHDVLFDGDLAIAIVGEPATVGDSTFESDSWFLIRQAGEWRVLPDFHAYNRPEYGFDAARLEAYKQLEEKAEIRCRKLRLEITGCEC